MKLDDKLRILAADVKLCGSSILGASGAVYRSLWSRDDRGDTLG
jgi:hypothetical protein